MTNRKNRNRGARVGNNPQALPKPTITTQSSSKTPTEARAILGPLNFEEYYMSQIEHPRPQTMPAIKELEALEEALPPKPADPRHLVEADGSRHVATREELDEFRFTYKIYLAELKDLYEARARLWTVLMDSVGVEVKKRLDSNHKEEKLAALTDNRNVVKLVKLLEQVCDELAVNRASIYRSEVTNAVFDETKQTFTEFVDWYDKKVTAAENGGEYFSEKDKAWFLMEALEAHRSELIAIVPDAYAVIKNDPKYPTFQYIRDRVSTYFTGKSRSLAGRTGGASSGNTRKRGREMAVEGDEQSVTDDFQKRIEKACSAILSKNMGKANKQEPPAKKARSDGPFNWSNCFNCWLPGHTSKECKKPRAKCPVSGCEGDHCKQAHAQIMYLKKKKAGGNGAKKATNESANSITIIGDHLEEAHSLYSLTVDLAELARKIQEESEEDLVDYTEEPEIDLEDDAVIIDGGFETNEAADQDDQFDNDSAFDTDVMVPLGAEMEVENAALQVGDVMEDPRPAAASDNAADEAKNTDPDTELEAKILEWVWRTLSLCPQVPDEDEYLDQLTKEATVDALCLQQRLLSEQLEHAEFLFKILKLGQDDKPLAPFMRGLRTRELSKTYCTVPTTGISTKDKLLLNIAALERSIDDICAQAIPFTGTVADRWARAGMIHAMNYIHRVPIELRKMGHNEETKTYPVREKTQTDHFSVGKAEAEQKSKEQEQKRRKLEVTAAKQEAKLPVQLHPYDSQPIDWDEEIANLDEYIPDFGLLNDKEVDQMLSEDGEMADSTSTGNTSMLGNVDLREVFAGGEATVNASAGMPTTTKRKSGEAEMEEQRLTNAINSSLTAPRSAPKPAAKPAEAPSAAVPSPVAKVHATTTAVPKSTVKTVAMMRSAEPTSAAAGIVARKPATLPITKQVEAARLRTNVATDATGALHSGTKKMMAAASNPVKRQAAALPLRTTAAAPTTNTLPPIPARPDVRAHNIAQSTWLSFEHPDRLNCMFRGHNDATECGRAVHIYCPLTNKPLCGQHKDAQRKHMYGYSGADRQLWTPEMELTLSADALNAAREKAAADAKATAQAKATVDATSAPKANAVNEAKAVNEAELPKPKPKFSFLEALAAKRVTDEAKAVAEAKVATEAKTTTTLTTKKSPDSGSGGVISDLTSEKKTDDDDQPDLVEDSDSDSDDDEDDGPVEHSITLVDSSTTVTVIPQPAASASTTAAEAPTVQTRQEYVYRRQRISRGWLRSQNIEIDRRVDSRGQMVNLLAYRNRVPTDWPTMNSISDEFEVWVLNQSKDPSDIIPVCTTSYVDWMSMTQLGHTLVPHTEDVFILTDRRRQLTPAQAAAMEQRDRRNAEALREEHDQREYAIDTGATVVVVRHDLNEFLQTRMTRQIIDLQTASGAVLTSDRVGQSSALGILAQCKRASIDLIGVLGMTTATPGLRAIFDATSVRLVHPMLQPDVVGYVARNRHYVITGKELRRLEVAKANYDSVMMASAFSGLRLATTTTGETDASAAATTNIVTDNDSDVDDDAVVRVAEAQLTPAQVRRAYQARQLHNVLSHPSDKTLIDSLNNGVIIGTHLTSQDVRTAAAMLGPCLACKVGKTHKPPYRESLDQPTTYIGEKIYCDIVPLDGCGCTDSAIGGYDNMLMTVDSYCNMLHLVPLKSKSTDNLIKAFDIILAEYTKNGHKPVGRRFEIISDSESDFKACNTALGQRSVHLFHSPPYQHNQRFERQMQTLKCRKRCLKAASPVALPVNLEGEVMRTAAYHLNDLTNTKFPTMSPRQMFENTKLDITKRTNIPMGTVAMLTFPEDKEARARLGVVLGPAERTRNANNCYVMDVGKIIVRDKRAIEPVQVIPQSFPWVVKKGGLNLTVKKRKTNKADTTKPDKRPKNDKVVETSKSTKEVEVVPTTQPETSKLIDSVRDMFKSVQSQEGDIVVDVPTDDVVDVFPQVPLETVQAQKPRTEPVLSFKEAMDKAMNARNAKLNQIQAAKAKEAEAKRTADRIGHMAANAMIDAFIDRLKTTESTGKSTEPSATEGNTISTTDADSSGKPVKPKASTEAAAPSRKSERLSKQKDQVMRRDRLERQARAAYQVSWLAKVREFESAYKISVKESLAGEHAQESHEAIISEIQNMLQYRVGHYVKQKDIPRDKLGNILQSFMFLKHKTLPDGSYDRTKARMVGNGANQKHHMYDLVSSSTVALSSVFLLFNIASLNRSKLTTYDIKGAFLHAQFGELDEVTYIRINKEVTKIWCELEPEALDFVDERGTLLLELDKFIYGLKQSPLKFQQHLNKVLTNLGYTPLTQDECLFVKHDGKDYSVLSTHVDDILQTATCQKFYDELKVGLTAAYSEITTTENGTAYLGMSIERSSEDSRFIKVTQQGLIDKIVKSYPKQTGDRQKYFSPSDDDLFVVTGKPEDKDLGEKERREFLSVLMTMMYLARLTRPDILLPVTFLASRTHCATSSDVRKLMRIVRYLEVSDAKGIYINCESLDIQCKCDASYAVHTPNLNTKGHTGFVVGLGSNMSYVHARSGKQKTASTSSTDAEVVGLCEALKFCTWCRNVLTELHITDLQKITVYQDNKSVIMMGTEYTAMKHSKHILTKLTYIKSMQESGAIRIQYLSTEEMTADVLSKALHGIQFNKHISSMMGLAWRNRFRVAVTKRAADASSDPSEATKCARR